MIDLLDIFGEGHTDFSSGMKTGTAQDIRFTRSKDNRALYAILLDWPGDCAAVTIGTLNPAKLDKSKIASVSMLGSFETLRWSQDASGLAVALPSIRPGEDAYALKLTLLGSPAKSHETNPAVECQ